MIKYRSLNAHLLGTRGMAVESGTGVRLNDNGEQAIATPNLVDRPAVCDCASNTEKMVKIICWSSLGSIMIKEKGGRQGEVTQQEKPPAVKATAQVPRTQTHLVAGEN